MVDYDLEVNQFYRFRLTLALRSSLTILPMWPHARKETNMVLGWVERQAGTSQLFRCLLLVPLEAHSRMRRVFFLTMFQHLTQTSIKGCHKKGFSSMEPPTMVEFDPLVFDKWFKISDV